LLPQNEPGGKQALLYVPQGALEHGPAPLAVMLHGAGGTARHSLDLVRKHADELGFILLAPSSQAASWDIISRREYGPDVGAIDALLERAFPDYPIDPLRLTVAGFSDGASYALSLGLMNGDLFSHVIAFSPGFMAPHELRGEPLIFISHGDGDAVLPVERCSRKIARQLRDAGRDFEYVEFAGGHVVPASTAREAFQRFVHGKPAGGRPPAG
jgi:phospholipase/carboxylesterase